MKYLDKFNSFTLNEDRIVYSSSRCIDIEVRETCFDILRDFNEENDSDLEIEVECAEVRKDKNQQFDVLGLNKKDDLIAVSCSSSTIEGNTKILTNDLRSKFFKHLIAYFNSLGYKSVEDIYYKHSFIFFYKEKI